MKRRRIIAKTSKQTIQPSLAEEEKGRGIRGKRERDERRREREKEKGGRERNKCKKNKRWREEGKKREGKTCAAGGVVCVLPVITRSDVGSGRCRDVLLVLAPSRPPKMA